MPGIALSGLSSGLDTNTIVSQLIALERQGRNKYQFQQANAQARTDTLGDISTKLNALKTKAQDFRLGGLWNPVQTVDVSDATKIAATRTGGAGAGATSIEVLGLASSSQRTFTFTSPGAAETWNFGSASVNIAAGATIDDAVGAINSVANSGVIAVNAAGKLVVSSTTTGAASAFTWAGGALSEDSAVAGNDAQYRINGGAIQTSATNSVVSMIPGVDVTLKALTTSPVSVTIGTPSVDKAKVVEKLKAFVEAYNTVIDTLKTTTTERKVTNPTTTTDARKGSLYADSGLRNLQSTLRTSISDAIGGLSNTNFDQLGEIGISTGAASGSINADSVAGKLVFDEAKFNAAFDANPSDVRALLGGFTGTDGVAQRFENLITPITQVGGVLANRRTETDADLKRLTDTLKRFDERLVNKERQLRAQFERMETLLARANANGGAVSNALAGLNANQNG